MLNLKSPGSHETIINLMQNYHFMRLNVRRLLLGWTHKIKKHIPKKSFGEGLGITESDEEEKNKAFGIRVDKESV